MKDGYAWIYQFDDLKCIIQFIVLKSERTNISPATLSGLQFVISPIIPSPNSSVITPSRARARLRYTPTHKRTSIYLPIRARASHKEESQGKTLSFSWLFAACHLYDCDNNTRAHAISADEDRPMAASEAAPTRTHTDTQSTIGDEREREREVSTELLKSTTMTGSVCQGRSKTEWCASERLFVPSRARCAPGLVFNYVRRSIFGPSGDARLCAACVLACARARVCVYTERERGTVSTKRAPAIACCAPPSLN